MVQDKDELTCCIRRRIKRYFKDLEGAQPHALYRMVIHAVEKPLLEIVLSETGGNQTAAANILGIDRNTLRKKISMYHIKP